MAQYDPPEPLWKRNTAAILDFLLVLFIGGYVLSKMPGNQPVPPPFAGAPGVQTVQLIGLGGWPAIVLVAVIVAYFVILGRTGGTLFQRLFGMRRAK